MGYRNTTLFERLSEPKSIFTEEMIEKGVKLIKEYNPSISTKETLANELKRLAYKCIPLA